MPKFCGKGIFRNRQISVTTLRALRRHGFETVFPTPGRGAYHATVRVPDPLPPDIAELIARIGVGSEAEVPILETNCVEFGRLS